jgi:hypothetical protein
MSRELEEQRNGQDEDWPSAQPTDDLDDDESFEDYRSLSGLAVAALIIGLCSPLAFFAPIFLLVPILGLLLGGLAIVRIWRESEYYTGTGLAVTGVLLSLALATTAGAMHTILGVLEVPEGYADVSFWDLQPDENHPESPIPPSALELDGKKVFVKGYVYPGMKRKQLKSFVLVPDMKSCCFGGQPKLTDMIRVTLKDPLRVDFAYRRRGLGGILRVHSQLRRSTELTGVYYELQADYLK